MGARHSSRCRRAQSHVDSAPGVLLFTSRMASSLSQRLDEVAQVASGDTVTLGALLAALGRQGHALLAFVLVTPFLQPVPIPMLSTALGAVVVVLGVQLARARSARLPKRLDEYAVSAATVRRICAAGQTLLRRAEHLIRPR